MFDEIKAALGSSVCDVVTVVSVFWSVCDDMIVVSVFWMCLML